MSANIEFDLLDYMAGMTNFVFDKSVLERIALDRGVSEIDDYEDLTQENKDLILADLLYTAYTGPNVIANHTVQHGSFTKSVGAQTVNKDELYQIFMGIYRRYDDAMVNVVSGTVSWLDF